jgi:type IV secretion system protein VirB2
MPCGEDTDVRNDDSSFLAREGQQTLRLFLWAVLLLAAATPLGAHAQDIAPVTSTMTAIHGFLQSTAIRTLAAIAVIGVGITAMVGRMRWAWAGSVIGGIVLIFGADQFVSFFTTSAGG